MKLFCGAKRRRAYRVLGLALSLAWSFCAFPPISFEGTFWSGLPLGTQSLLRLALVGLIPCVLISLAPRLLTERSSIRASGTVAVLLWCGGWMGNVLLDRGASVAPRALALFVLGMGTAYFLVFWGLAFTEEDEEGCEQDFVRTILVVGALVLAVNAVREILLAPFLLATPLIQGGLLVAWTSGGVPSSQGCGADPSATDKEEASATTVENNGGRLLAGWASGPVTGSLVVLVLRTALAVLLVSFTWCMFSMSSANDAFFETVLFGCGFMLAGAVIWLFVKYSPSIGFVAATRWVLPMMAVGLLCNTSASPSSLMGACLLLSMSHATFEMLLRMQIVRFARSHPRYRVAGVGFGFAAIMTGAFVGPVAYLYLMDSDIVDSLHLTLVVLCLLVVVGSMLFAGFGRGAASSEKAPVREEDKAAVPASAVGQAPSGSASLLVAERFGLTAREREILELLLEGRSRPYIRDTLYLSLSTVDTHIRHIYAKANVHNKQELIDLSQQLQER